MFSTFCYPKACVKCNHKHGPSERQIHFLIIEQNKMTRQKMGFFFFKSYFICFFVEHENKRVYYTTQSLNVTIKSDYSYIYNKVFVLQSLWVNT